VRAAGAAPCPAPSPWGAAPCPAPSPWGAAPCPAPSPWGAAPCPAASPWGGEPSLGGEGGCRRSFLPLEEFDCCGRQDFAPHGELSAASRCCCDSPPSAGRAGQPEHSETGAGAGWGDRPWFLWGAWEVQPPPRSRGSRRSRDRSGRASLGWAAPSPGALRGVGARGPAA